MRQLKTPLPDSFLPSFLAAAVLLLRPPLPGHRAEDAQDVVRVPAHAAQGVRRQLRERHPQGADHHRRHRRGSQQHRHPDHRSMRETERDALAENRMVRPIKKWVILIQYTLKHIL